LLSNRSTCVRYVTGTPLQNNLEELFALLHFLEPVKFKDPAQLAAAFTVDAAQIAGGGGGESGDSSDDEETREAVAEAAATQLKNLHELLGNHMLRRLKRDVLKGLPKKRKVEVSCQLSPFQREVYADILARNHRAFNQGTHASQRTSLLNVLKELQKVCNHPFLFPSAEKDAFKAARTSGLAKKIAAAAAAEAAAAKSASGGSGGGGSGGAGGSGGGSGIGGDVVKVAPPVLAPSPLEATLLRTSSGKMQLLAKMLPKLKERGHRILLFCQMTRMIDLLEDWLRASGMGFEHAVGLYKLNSAYPQLTHHGLKAPGSYPWSCHVRNMFQAFAFHKSNLHRYNAAGGGDGDEEKVYGRIDGSTPSSERQRCINEFNTPGSSVYLLLISTRAGGAVYYELSYPLALESVWFQPLHLSRGILISNFAFQIQLVPLHLGGLGLNLATADTIILFDPDFNPFVDLQAQARAHRMVGLCTSRMQLNSVEFVA
jgi:chromodomain-helicase-DNA-binding protein 4